MIQEKGRSGIIILTFASLIIGILLGTELAHRNYALNSSSFLNSGSLSRSNGKVSQIMDLIDRNYVDSLDVAKFSEELSADLVAKLDPHSVYIPFEDTESSDEELRGSFSGIGVQFNIQNDTVMVVGVISGGPSEKVGVLAGDRIVQVNDSSFTGKKINNEKVLKTLKGPEGTKVKLGVKRYGTKKILNYTITRGTIPVNSVDIAYQIVPGTGVIKINKFSATTYQELLDAIASLKAGGAKKFIIDLRENSGGLLDQCVRMVNEFLPKDDMIVYAQGKAYPKMEYKADGTGTCIHEPLVILIDEFSASASEIFSGAMQDNDRAIIVGRRSFGKGLVQQPFRLADGSELRLTVARYYTPSGRCIQKPYKRGEQESYNMDIINRFKHGELESADSITFADTIKYKTRKGRIVHGGGGIMPDHFIPRDTSSFTPYFNQIINSVMIFRFAFKYTDDNRTVLKTKKNWKSMEKYLDSQNLLNEFKDYASKNGISPKAGELAKSGKEISRRLKSYISRNILGDDGFYPIYYQTDENIRKALEILQ